MTSQSSKSDGGNGIGGGNCGAGVVGSVGDICENSGKGSGRTGCSMGMGGDSIVLTESIGRTGELGGRTQEGGRGPDGFRR